MLCKEKSPLLRFNTSFIFLQKNISLRFNDLVSVLVSSRLKFFAVFECRIPRLVTEKTAFSRPLFADVISEHNGNMKLACQIEFEFTSYVIKAIVVIPVALHPESSHMPMTHTPFSHSFAFMLYSSLERHRRLKTPFSL